MTAPGVPTDDVRRLLHPSASPSDRPLSLTAMHDIAEGLARTFRGTQPPPGVGEVVRDRILGTAAYDAWIVSLGPRSVIEPHDHEGSIGVITVTAGRLIEFGLGEDGRRRSRLRQMVAGDTTEVGITQRHSLATTDTMAATMVQVFSPPLGSEVTPAV
jgi:quercetin dioxygenase-like cupin family protein